MEPINRRSFLKTSTLGAAGLIALPYCKSPNQQKGNWLDQAGLQLYTVREGMSKDPIGTLERVAAMGYKELETAGYSDGKLYGMNPVEFKKIVEDLGMRIVSGHFSPKVFAEDWGRALNMMNEIDQSFAVLPWLPPEQRSPIDKYYEVADLLNRCGKEAEKSGKQVCYHNHDFEFSLVDGEMPMEVLLRQTDEQLVKFELDLYWLRRAGLDVLAYLQKFPGRFTLWHVKDMDDSVDQRFTEVGTGVINFPEIFNNATLSGMKHYFIEQDVSENPLKSIATSYENLKKMF
jgi:sugar phosphate isomerase/epimerase